MQISGRLTYTLDTAEAFQAALDLVANEPVLTLVSQDDPTNTLVIDIDYTSPPPA